MQQFLIERTQRIMNTQGPPTESFVLWKGKYPDLSGKNCDLRDITFY
jgi:hypothetical protein